MKKIITRILLYSVLLAYIATIVYPMFLMVVTSLKPNQDIFQRPLGLPTSIYVENFTYLFTRANYGTYFLNSIIVVLVSLALIVMLSSPAAFVFAGYRFKWDQLLYLYFIAGMIIPIRLGTISVLKMFVAMKLNDTILCLILINSAIGIPLGIFILTDFIRMIPADLFSSARIDGCSEPNIFLKIVLPLLKPAIAALAIVNFIPIWNDFWFPLILIKSDAAKTIPLATAQLFGQFRTNFGLVFAALTMASIPIILFYLLFSKFFTKGLFQGAVKG
ncbi:binding-protein-dependent transport systems inner membrane component [Candidatus Moduliflexus flocculans]|uniref:Binding-protein-dependent transport systems inner membrane component n=1 Tax=Candidatus Moduliflexus flocculans TaxID=1499966 RepID=A0A0S6VU30_9BACT|nr:binding-protein-dependent transport systems inner membrane component [Candidatus Moduliflexus flocculans]